MIDIFKWDKNFITGIKTIDEQHMRLIQIINKGIQLCINETSIRKEKILSIKKNIEEYITIHFTTEEKLMNYFSIYEKHVNEHKKAHNDFVEKFHNYFIDEEYSITHISEILEYLIRWLAYHILNTDKSLSKQIELIQQGEIPRVAYEKEIKETEKSIEPLLKALRELFYIVSEKNRELEIINHGLEHRVRQRTMELEEANKRLEALSLTDSLTGLPNRRYVEIIIDQLIETWRRYKRIFSLMFIDIDNFKMVNDKLGHETGDKLLKWIAGILKYNLRKSDIVCRLGGDEFIVVCPESDIESASIAANSLLRKIKDNYKDKLFGGWIPSISIGLTVISENDDTLDALLSNSDKAMYESKRKGGNLTTTSD